MDSNHVTTTYVILDPKALIADLDFLVPAGELSADIPLTTVRSLIYKYTKIVAASMVVTEEFAAHVDPEGLTLEVYRRSMHQIADEVAKGLVLNTEVIPVEHPYYSAPRPMRIDI